MLVFNLTLVWFCLIHQGTHEQIQGKHQFAKEELLLLSKEFNHLHIFILLQLLLTKGSSVLGICFKILLPIPLSFFLICLTSLHFSQSNCRYYIWLLTAYYIGTFWSFERSILTSVPSPPRDYWSQICHDFDPFISYCGKCYPFLLGVRNLDRVDSYRLRWPEQSQGNTRMPSKRTPAPEVVLLGWDGKLPESADPELHVRICSQVSQRNSNTSFTGSDIERERDVKAWGPRTFECELN